MDIKFVHNPLEKDIKKIHNGILDYNSSYFNDLQIKNFGCFLYDKDNEVCGGLTGKISNETIFVDYFWIPESKRVNSTGSKIMNKLEVEAKSLGVKSICLDTYTFQAPGFYKKLGFIEVGRFEDYPKKGIDTIFFQKKI
jgi:N-acetylglutamate synthase-like GNAT family acetyltransferase